MDLKNFVPLLWDTEYLYCEYLNQQHTARTSTLHEPAAHCTNQHTEWTSSTLHTPAAHCTNQQHTERTSSKLHVSLARCTNQQCAGSVHECLTGTLQDARGKLSLPLWRRNEWLMCSYLVVRSLIFSSTCLAIRVVTISMVAISINYCSLRGADTCGPGDSVHSGVVRCSRLRHSVERLRHLRTGR